MVLRLVHGFSSIDRARPGATAAGSQVLTATQARTAPAVVTDPVLKAMGDEIDRSIAQLKLNDLDKPYFIQYVVYDDEDFTASATFGALSRSSQTHQRLVHAQVRVGNYDFDNTGFAGARGGGTSTRCSCTGDTGRQLRCTSTFALAGDRLCIQIRGRNHRSETGLYTESNDAG